MQLTFEGKLYELIREKEYSGNVVLEYGGVAALIKRKEHKLFIKDKEILKT